ncbi:hypothetical protein [Cetobacterium sp. SF1]|uniref:hypothetical protein n=1 Tax=Cetobacterium sp. SF1 TaxID=3417654 RepID=UPI003CFBA905
MNYLFEEFFECDSNLIDNIEKIKAISFYLAYKLNDKEIKKEKYLEEDNCLYGAVLGEEYKFRIQSNPKDKYVTIEFMTHFNVSNSILEDISSLIRAKKYNYA